MRTPNRSSGRNHDEDDIYAVTMILLAMAFCILALYAMGCYHMPEHVRVRGPHGTKLADINTTTGDIKLTHYGLHALQPKVILPEAK